MADVALEAVFKSYDGRNAVIHGIDLKIRDGEFVVFVGPSGCGKSTLLRMIAGLETISGGTVRIDGQVVNERPPRERDIAMVFQDYALYPHKSLYDNMAFGLRLRGTDDAEIKRRVMDAARLLKIDHMLDRRPAQLSGGQRQRVAIGRAIVRQPKVFLFDEPLSNLDAQLRGEMRSEIKRLHQRLGTTIVYVTHDQVEAMTLADRIAVLSAGHLLQYDTPDTVYQNPAAVFVAGFTGAPPMNLVDGVLSSGLVDLGSGVQVALHADHRSLTGTPTQVTFGLRPENLTLARQTDVDVSVNAEVVLLESLGAETLVTLKVGNAEMVARCPAAFREPQGRRLQMYFNPKHVRLFDATSGVSLT